MDETPTDQADSDYLPPREAAKVLHVTTRTLARMAERGDIDVITLPSGHRRYSRASLVALGKAAS